MSILDKIITDEFACIGKNKYRVLKTYDFEKMTAEQMVEFRKRHKMSVAEAEKQIEKFEKFQKKHNLKPSKTLLEYQEKLKNPSEIKVKVMTKKWLHLNFTKAFLKNENKKFLISDESIENIKPLIYYFIGDFENFKKCGNVSKISEPSLKKGLLIIGGYGNGKTSVMRAIEIALKLTNVSFKGHSANQVIKEYENCENGADKKIFDKRMLSGTKYFDDVLTERLASNYGKSNVFKDILEERYSRGRRTYITCNYLDGNNDLEASLDAFGHKYGDRVYDRIFEMFNVIEFKGKSFRK